MAADKPENDPFLAALDVKIAALQQLRDSYVAAASVGAIGALGNVDFSGTGTLAPPNLSVSGTAGAAQSAGPIELPTGVFRNKGLADAIRLYLSIAKGKRTLKEIAAALEEGGLATTAGNFEQNISATLYRLKNAGEMLKFKDGWDLAASYPESFRQRMTQINEGPPKRKRKAKKKSVTPKKADATSTE